MLLTQKPGPSTCINPERKTTKDRGKLVLKINFNRTSGHWGCEEKLFFIIQKGMYIYEYMGD